ncbi:SRPBCC family protein [Brevibacillus migulae]|uniref:SRPBCC family protein n=1 Tax=Brevibacillus migulae TaxID=1644114 RepID=UPI001F318C5A|nr:SRPBCC family protein [Brevibacillus migulae]
MDNVTKVFIEKPASDVFEAFVDPAKIGNFWFSSSSDRWEQGKTITLTYVEYNAELAIEILEVEPNEKIVFRWGANGEGHIVTILLRKMGNSNTLIEVTEAGFQENDENVVVQLLDNKEGWVFMLTCLKAYLEFGVTRLRTGLAK